MKIEHESFGEIILAIAIGLITAIPLYLGIRQVDNMEATYQQVQHLSKMTAYPKINNMIIEANEDYISVGEYHKISSKYRDLQKQNLTKGVIKDAKRENL